MKSAHEVQTDLVLPERLELSILTAVGFESTMYTNSIRKA